MVKYNSELWDNYMNACNDYLFNFCNKHELDYEPNDWIGGEPGVIEIADLFISLSDMITDIEMDAPASEYIKYYDYSLNCHYADLPCMNYVNWLNGAPRHDIETLKKMAKEGQEKMFRVADEEYKKHEYSGPIEQLKEELKEYIDDYVHSIMVESPHWPG